ncbi:MAG: glycosyltransferase family 2 protein [Candidatus Paceibacterota bacterium]
MKKLSIVVPVYWNELNIPHTVPRLQKFADGLQNYETELIFVDDGSGDKSYDMLVDLARKDMRIKVVKLSRNFGSTQAISAGMLLATGDCVGMITSDLQDPPELFGDMIHKWEDGNKVVIAVRADREEAWSQKLFAKIFYSLMARLALPGYPIGGFDFFLIDRQVAQEVVSIREKNTNIMSLIFWLGHKRASLSYVRQKRQHGKSRWTFMKKLKYFIDSFVAFSYAPVRFISTIGMFTAVASFVFGVYVITQSILGNISVSGYAALMSVVTFLLGLIMIMLGIIGEYLWRTLDETRKRPSFVIDETHGWDKK